MVVGAAGDAGGGLLDLSGVGAVIGVPVNVVSTGAVIAGGGLMAGAAGDLMMHASSDDSTSPARTDNSGAGGDDGFQPTDGFRGSEFSKDEIVEFVNGHTGDGDPTMGRPSQTEIEKALESQPEKLDGQNAELFRSGNVKVIVNYDMPWRSTSYYVGGK
jgi:hypothetical protein